MAPSTTLSRPATAELDSAVEARWKNRYPGWVGLLLARSPWMLEDAQALSADGRVDYCLAVNSAARAWPADTLVGGDPEFLAEMPPEKNPLFTYFVHGGDEQRDRLWGLPNVTLWANDPHDPGQDDDFAGGRPRPLGLARLSSVHAALWLAWYSGLAELRIAGAHWRLKAGEASIYGDNLGQPHHFECPEHKRLNLAAWPTMRAAFCRMVKAFRLHPARPMTIIWPGEKNALADMAEGRIVTCA